MSVRQRAADLLYAMCDRSNAKQIVAEMLSYLETADYSIREEMVNTSTTWQPLLSAYHSHCVSVYSRCSGTDGRIVKRRRAERSR